MRAQTEVAYSSATMVARLGTDEAERARLGSERIAQGQLLGLREWLKAHGVIHVSVESQSPVERLSY